jgi:hypothetical protein
VVVAELNFEKSEADRQPNVVEFAVAHVRTLAKEPITDIGCDIDSAPDAVRVVVATDASFAGEPFVVVQYESCPDVSCVEVEIEPVALIVTAPVAPDTVTLEPARIEVTPEFVSTPPLFVSPEPTSDVNVDPPRIRLVVEAVVNDAYVVDEYEKVWRAFHVFVSPSSVDDAAPDSDVRNPASLLNHDSLTDDEAIVFNCPPVPRYANPCDGDVNRVFPLNVFVLVNVFAVYVLGIVVEEWM